MSKEALPQKRKVRAGHWVLVTWLLNLIDGALVLAASPTDSNKLALLKLSLHESWKHWISWIQK